jgi:hypothetical protein
MTTTSEAITPEPTTFEKIRTVCLAIGRDFLQLSNNADSAYDNINLIEDNGTKSIKWVIDSKRIDSSFRNCNWGNDSNVSKAAQEKTEAVENDLRKEEFSVLRENSDTVTRDIFNGGKVLDRDYGIKLTVTMPDNEETLHALFSVYGNAFKRSRIAELLNSLKCVEANVVRRREALGLTETPDRESTIIEGIVGDALAEAGFSRLKR